MKIPYQPFFIKKNIKKNIILKATGDKWGKGTLYLLLQFLKINMEKLNGPMEVIHEPLKIIPGDHTYCLANNFTPCYACQDKSNLMKALVSKVNKLNLENKQLKHRSVMKTATFTWKKRGVPVLSIMTTVYVMSEPVK